MHGSRAAALLALASLVLAGCSSPSAPLDDGPRLSRHLSVHLSSEPTGESPQELLEENTNVSFEYTHAGSPVDPATVQVRYVDPDGRNVSAPLASFTGQASVEAGEMVAIEPGAGGSPEADPFTPVAVVAGGKTLASRQGGDRDWMKAGGLPLPLAFERAGATSWTVQASGAINLRLSGLTASMEQESCDWDPATESMDCAPRTSTLDLQRLEVALEERISGTVRATTSLPAAGPLLTLSATGAGRANASLDVSAVVDGESNGGTVDGWGEVQVVDSRTSFQFGTDGELQSITRQHEVILDGDMDATGDFGPGPELEHPIEHDILPPERTPYDPEEAATDELVAFLLRAWSLDIAVGDEIAFDMGLGSEGQSSFVSQVLALESRDVGGTSRPAYKLSDRFVLRLTPDDSAPQVFSYDYLYWVDAQSYLPLYMQGHMERTFNHIEIEGYARVAAERMGEELRIDVPSTSSLTLRLDSSVAMSEAGNDLATSPVLGAAAIRLVPMVSATFLLGPAIGGFGMGMDRSHDEAVMPEPAPYEPSEMPPPDAFAPGTGGISGLVLDASYRPVAGALVSVEGMGASIQTEVDGSGAFALWDLEPGMYVVQARAPRHGEASATVEVFDGAYAEVEVQLPA